jgi:hypothetical protein
VLNGLLHLLQRRYYTTNEFKNKVVTKRHVCHQIFQPTRKIAPSILHKKLHFVTISRLKNQRRRSALSMHFSENIIDEWRDNTKQSSVILAEAMMQETISLYFNFYIIDPSCRTVGLTQQSG